MTIIDKVVSWAESIAQDDSHGYDQNNRWSPDYDCSSFVISAWEFAGVPVKTNGATYTGNMVEVFKKCGFIDATSSVLFNGGDGLRKGDVLWRTGHTALVTGASGNLISVTQASINENGETTGGETGDQTGKEIYTDLYKNNNWELVLRYVDVSELDWISRNGYLNQSERENNARIIFSFLSSKGWTKNAIAGLLGNMEHESTINPGIWESLTTNPEEYYNENERYPGYGLVQWTPYTKYVDWCGDDWQTNHDKQLDRIIYELENGLQYYPTTVYPETFEEFSKSTKSAYYLGCAFLHNYERPLDPDNETRGNSAEKWYEFLGGYSGGTDTPIERPELKIPIWLLFKMKGVI